MQALDVLVQHVAVPGGPPLRELEPSVILTAGRVKGLVCACTDIRCLTPHTLWVAQHRQLESLAFCSSADPDGADLPRREVLFGNRPESGLHQAPALG